MTAVEIGVGSGRQVRPVSYLRQALFRGDQQTTCVDLPIRPNPVVPTLAPFSRTIIVSVLGSLGLVIARKGPANNSQSAQ